MHAYTFICISGTVYEKSFAFGQTWWLNCKILIGLWIVFLYLVFFSCCKSMALHGIISQFWVKLQSRQAACSQMSYRILLTVCHAIFSKRVGKISLLLRDKSQLFVFSTMFFISALFCSVRTKRNFVCDWAKSDLPVDKPRLLSPWIHYHNVFFIHDGHTY